MYLLVAEASTPQWGGVIGREQFETLEGAERTMERWARFGVDGYCNEADRMSIFDAHAVEVRRWSWATRRPEPVEQETPGIG